MVSAACLGFKLSSKDLFSNFQCNVAFCSYMFLMITLIHLLFSFRASYFSIYSKKTVSLPSKCKKGRTLIKKLVHMSMSTFLPPFTWASLNCYIICSFTPLSNSFCLEYSDKLPIKSVIFDKFSLLKLFSLHIGSYRSRIDFVISDGKHWFAQSYSRLLTYAAVENDLTIVERLKIDRMFNNY